MLVVVGSLNPLKLAAAATVLRRVYGGAVRVVAVEVPSGVAPQPWGDAETLRGARNRAQAALAARDAALGVGLEGGVVAVGDRLFTNAWCALLRPDGTEGIAGGENVLLPDEVTAALHSGAELGTAIDALTGEKDTKHHGGAIGALTGGLLDRQTAYEHIVTLALARLVNPHYYEKEETL